MVSRKNLVRSGAALAALGSTLTIGLMGTTPVHADPKQFTAFVGYGSDTTEQVTNAFAGFQNNINYTPLQAGSTRTQLASWDATPDNQCFIPKTGAPAIHRPNGSSEGRAILSHQINADGYGSAACGGLKNVANTTDFARSSSTVSNATGELTYIPFGRDAVSFAYYRASGGAPVTDLSQAELDGLFTNGPTMIDGVNIIPCGIQTGSGTFSFWNGALPVTTAEEDSATATCRALAGGDAFGRIQENNTQDLKAKGDLAPAGSQVIVGFSAANYIAKYNGVASDGIAAGVGLGSIEGLGLAYNGTVTSPPTGTLTARSEFYSNGTFGRYVNFVLPTTRATGAGDFTIKSMFVNSTSPAINVDGDGLAEICEPAAQATANAFGFLSVPADCGTTTRRGPLVLSQPS